MVSDRKNSGCVVNITITEATITAGKKKDNLLGLM